MYSVHCGCSRTYLVCVWHTVLGTLRDPVSHILVLILGAVALDDSSLQLFQMEALLLPHPANTPSFEPLCSRLVLPSVIGRCPLRRLWAHSVLPVSHPNSWWSHCHPVLSLQKVPS